MTTTAMVRSNEVIPFGPDALIPGAPADRITKITFVSSNQELAVNQSAVGHYVCPCDMRVVAVEDRITAQQAAADGTIEINKNGSLQFNKTIATTEATGARAWTVGSGATNDVDTSAGEDLFSKGDLITFTRPNTGTTGKVVVTLTLIPR